MTMSESSAPARPGRVPGCPSVTPPASAARTDLRSLLSSLEDSVKRETSASAKARALLVCSDLQLRLGQPDQAKTSARQAADVSPKLAFLAAQARMLQVDEPQTAARRLETLMRLAAHPPSRVHAALLLSRQLTRQGDAEAAGEVLDQLARAGHNDQRVQLARLLSRLARGDSLAGLPLDDSLREEADALAELLGGARASSVRPSLCYYRVAVELRAGRLSDAFLELSKFPIEDERKHELIASHLARRPGGLRTSLELLAKEAVQRPTRSVVRAFAARCLEAGQRAKLQELLARGELHSYFSLPELDLLTALGSELAPASNRSGQFSSPEAENEARSDLLLSRALQFESELQDATSLTPELRRARLGQRLGRSLEAKERISPRDVIDLLAAAQELDEAPLLESLRLALAASEGDLLGLSSSLAQLGANIPALCALAAMLAEAGGNYDSARQLYRALLDSREPYTEGEASTPLSDSLAALARRALRELTPDLDMSLSSPTAADDGRTPPELSDLLEAIALCAASSSPDQQQLQHLLEQAARPVFSTAAQLIEFLEDRSGWLARLPFLPPIAEQLNVGAPDEWTAIGPEQLNLILRASLAIALTDTEPSAASAVLSELESTDLSLGLLARCLDPTRSEVLEGSASTWLAWLNVAQATIASPPLRTLELLRAALSEHHTPTASVFEEHLLELAAQPEPLANRLLDQLRAASQPHLRYQLLARLSALEWERGNAAGALLFQRTILEEEPTYLPALLWVEEALLAEGHTDEWRTLQKQIRTALLERPAADGDAMSYQLTSAYAALGVFDSATASRELLPLLDAEDPPLVALLWADADARRRRDDQSVTRTSSALLAHAATSLDHVSGKIDAALGYARTGNRQEARQILSEARQLRPDDFVIELFALHLLEDDGLLGQAEGLEALARAASHPRHRARIFRAAGGLWQEAHDAPRARYCYEECLKGEPTSVPAREALRLIYRNANEKEQLRDLLTSQLELSPEPEQAIDLELELASALIELGAPDEAKSRLERVLATHPHTVGVLRAHAEVSAALGEHQAALTSLSSLAHNLPQGAERTAVQRSLGHLYEQQFGALEKAMDTYEAVLAAEPDDADSARRLVHIYTRLGLAERATSLLTKLIQSQPSASDKKKDALYLASLYETLAGDSSRAAATLERTRRAWPLDASVLAAVFGFMQRQGQASGARMMIARAGKEIQRQLESSRLTPSLLDALAEVRDLSDLPEQAALIRVARAAYAGDDVLLAGAGARALDPELEQLLAPSELAYPLRALLRKTARALDAAFPLDTSALGARPLGQGRVKDRLEAIAASMGQPAPDLFVAEALGSRTAPLTVHPSRLLIGPRTEALEDEVIDFLLYRTLKLQQLGGGALSRSAPEDGWPMLVALLQTFAPHFRPREIDGKKTAQARALVEQGLGRVGYDDDVPTLVLETIGALGGQSKELVATPRLLANRAAMLATHGPGVALRALAAGHPRPLPERGPSRSRFIAASTEARDVLLYCTTEQFAAARQLLTLSAAPRLDPEEFVPVLEEGSVESVAALAVGAETESQTESDAHPSQDSSR